MVSGTVSGQIIPDDTISYSGLDNWLDSISSSGYYVVGSDTFYPDPGEPLLSADPFFFYEVSDSLLTADITGYYIYPSLSVTSDGLFGAPDISDGVNVWFEADRCFVETPDSTYIYFIELKHKTR
jgi:hypothetical protein